MCIYESSSPFFLSRRLLSPVPRESASVPNPTPRIIFQCSCRMFVPGSVLFPRRNGLGLRSPCLFDDVRAMLHPVRRPGSRGAYYQNSPRRLLRPLREVVSSQEPPIGAGPALTNTSLFYHSRLFFRLPAFLLLLLLFISRNHYTYLYQCTIPPIQTHPVFHFHFILMLIWRVAVCRA